MYLACSPVDDGHAEHGDRFFDLFLIYLFGSVEKS